MVRRGLGVTVTATSALEAIDTEGLATIRIDSALAVRDVGIIMHKDKKLSPVAKRFVDDLLESRKKPLRNA
jgi:DNA-binding transcriptional LysR family regulator